MILIEHNQLKGLHVKKLSGRKKLYRVRVGKFRIIFEEGYFKNEIIKVNEKDGQTYKNL